MVIMYIEWFIMNLLKLILFVHTFIIDCSNRKGSEAVLILVFETISRDQRPQANSTCEKKISITF